MHCKQNLQGTQKRGQADAVSGGSRLGSSTTGLHSPTLSASAVPHTLLVISTEFGVRRAASVTSWMLLKLCESQFLYLLTEDEDWLVSDDLKGGNVSKSFDLVVGTY